MPPKNDQNHIDFKGTDLEHKLFKILSGEDELEKLIDQEMSHVDKQKTNKNKDVNDYSVEKENPKLYKKKVKSYDKKSSIS